MRKMNELTIAYHQGDEILLHRVGNHGVPGRAFSREASEEAADQGECSEHVLARRITW